MLAKNLKMEVVAEGIENDKQFQQLYGLGCKVGQGYLFSRPLSKEAIEEMLINGTFEMTQPKWLTSTAIFNSSEAFELANLQ